MKVLKIAMCIWTILILTNYGGYNKTKDSDFVMDTKIDSVKSRMPDSIRFHHQVIKPFKGAEVTITE